MDRLDALQVLCAVVDAGSFSRGAERLGISTSSVTNQVAALEAHFGVRLLNRSTRSMSLTDEGRQCYEQAQRLLADMGDLETGLRGAGATPRGVLRVDMPGLIARSYVAPALPGFMALYPEITVRASASDRLIDMVEEGVDVMVRIGALADSGLLARPLMETRYVCCAAPSYLARQGMPHTPADLAHHECLGFVLPKSRQLRPWVFQAANGQAAGQQLPQGRIAMDHVDSLLALCEAGAGIGQFLSLSVAEPLRRGTLVPVLVDWQAPGPGVSALYQHRHLRTAKVQVFLDFLSGVFSPAASQLP
jgi:LysR family transcriptional regulator for bpeEF and oprC